MFNLGPSRAPQSRPRPARVWRPYITLSTRLRANDGYLHNRQYAAVEITKLRFVDAIRVPRQASAYDVERAVVERFGLLHLTGIYDAVDQRTGTKIEIKSRVYCRGVPERHVAVLTGVVQHRFLNAQPRAFYYIVVKGPEDPTIRKVYSCFPRDLKLLRVSNYGHVTFE